MDDEVLLVVDDICEEIIGYIGQWLDENPNFQQSTAKAVMDEISYRVNSYIENN